MGDVVRMTVFSQENSYEISAIVARESDVNAGDNAGDNAGCGASENDAVSHDSVTYNSINSMDHVDSLDNSHESESNVGVAILEKPSTDEDSELDDGSNNADRYAHYVRGDKVERSMRTGRPVIALCGKVWIPRRINDNKYPICPDCKKIFEQIGNFGF